MAGAAREALRELHAIETALDRARDVLLAYVGKTSQLETKSAEFDLVTEADRESERVIKRVLAEMCPDMPVLAEETATTRKREPGPRFVVDPLDGTTNFSHGMPLFCATIALEVDGVAHVGGIDAPCLGERYLAMRGQFALCNRTPIRVSAHAELSRCLLVTGFPYDRRARLDHYLAKWKRALLEVQGVLRLGSAALDLAFVASGRLDGFWEEHLAPWDTSAGALLVEQAGGTVTTFSGDRFLSDAPSIVASNGRIHESLLRIVADG